MTPFQGSVRCCRGGGSALVGSLRCALAFAGIAAPAAEPFRIEIVDKGNGWPVPMVELETTHGVKFVTDNAGLIAFDAAELMGQETWCSVRGFGYGVAKDGFGFEGVRVTPQRGGRVRLELDRRIVAKRLGRITGAGLFCESERLDASQSPLETGVVGCDSVQNATLDGKLFWLWGDTSLARHPLGIFDGTAARTPLRPVDRFEPPIRLNLEYYRDPAGAPKPIATLPGSGPTWLTGVVSVADAGGKMHLVGTYLKIKPPLEAYRAGLCVWDGRTEQFTEHKVIWEQSRDRPRTRPLLEGHAVAWRDDAGKSWLLFGNPFPVMRCPAAFESWADPDTWEPLEAPKRIQDPGGKVVVPHSGSIAWNPWRRRWVAIFLEKFGKPSAFGELWYAEAGSPLGPWGVAVKVVSHENYTFYNPRIHAEFTDASSPILVFEATFTRQFADAPPPVARYDYNQVLYRLDLDDDALEAARAGGDPEAVPRPGPRPVHAPDR